MRINFFKGYNLIEILDKKKIIPFIQLEDLKKGIFINPELSPPPHEWLIKSFEWYFVLELLPEFTYGPFYRIDGNVFWPQIGIPNDIQSEKKCFYCLEKPKNIADAKRLYDLKDSNDMSYVYEFRVKISRDNFFYDPLMFIGPVKNGEGFQANPNSTTVKIIIFTIMDREVVRYRINHNGEYSETSEKYLVP